MGVLALTKPGEIDADNGRPTRGFRPSILGRVVPLFVRDSSPERVRPGVSDTGHLRRFANSEPYRRVSGDTT
jgi:hypothetical protein